jgi:hypothetical protein
VKQQTRNLFAFDGTGIFTVFLSGVFLSVYYIKLDSKQTVFLFLVYFVSILSQMQRT